MFSFRSQAPVLLAAGICGLSLSLPLIAEANQFTRQGRMTDPVQAATPASSQSQASTITYQRNMQAALISLNQARESLKQANSDKGGYRVEALRSVEEAMRQVRAGMKYDFRNDSGDKGQKD